MVRTDPERGAIRRRFADVTADVGDTPRAILAAKTAFAAVIAWLLAPMIPFAEDQYSYYAPLGALVTMYPTLARSARSGVQALLGLALGIALGLGGLALVYAGILPAVALAGVVGLGVLLGGIRVLGVGRDWVPLAALFVLLLGGGDADGFSISYLATMGFGVIVGIAVNFLIFPPLFARRASDRLSVLREHVAAQLRALSAGVSADDLDRETIDRDLTALADTVAAVTGDVREAAESGTANPRRRTQRRTQDENARRLPALERTAFLTRDLADVLTRTSEPGAVTLDAAAREELALAVDRVAELVATPLGAREAQSRMDAALDALAAFSATVDHQREVRPSHVAEASAAALCLRRIIDASRPFVGAEG